MIFYVSELQKIQILLNEQDKVNVYGYESENLHVFDEVRVVYSCGEEKIILAEDTIRYIVETFSVFLAEALKNKLQLAPSLSLGNVGCLFSKARYVDDDEQREEDDVFQEYWVWSSPSNMQTWLYNIDSKIYLEISSTYKWLFSDFEKEMQCSSFDKYVKDYKPLVIVELQRQLVQLWLDKCHYMLGLEKCF